MKKLLMLGLFLLSLAGVAQKQTPDERPGKHFKEMTPEQRATLASKQLALALDLSPSQIGSVKQLELQKAKDHQAMKEKRSDAGSEGAKVGPDDTFQRMNSRLDQKLAYKTAMKQILSEEQYERWEGLKMHRGRHGHPHRGEHNRNAGRR